MEKSPYRTEKNLLTVREKSAYRAEKDLLTAREKTPYRVAVKSAYRAQLPYIHGHRILPVPFLYLAYEGTLRTVKFLRVCIQHICDGRRQRDSLCSLKSQNE